MYKDIFNRIVLIVTQPAKAWDMLAQEEEGKEDVLSRFVYPLIGMLTVAAFLGAVFTHKGFDTELALKASIRELVAAFGGFFLSAYLLNELGYSRFKMEKDLALWQRFVGYASSLMFVLNAVLMLVPEFFFLRMFTIYTFYIIWEGTGVYLKTEEKSRLRFVGTVTAVVLIMPYVIREILSLLMPGMRF